MIRIPLRSAFEGLEAVKVGVAANVEHASGEENIKHRPSMDRLLGYWNLHQGAHAGTCHRVA